jgi:flagellar biosynthesis/type III secretory pathway M-ring protein FliF/YscJ
MIPADRVHDVRLKLATQGLPKGSVSGFELMEGSKFGITQFQERVNFQRALEGELTRSIQACRRCRTPVCTWPCPTRMVFSASSKSLRLRCC